MKEYKIVGPCSVAGVAPGDTVSEGTLLDWHANIEALMGVHLEELTVADTKAKGAKGKDKGGVAE